MTGAAGGQGAAEARALAAEGARVIATDLAAPDLDAPILVRPLDVTDQTAWSELAGWLREHSGRVDGAEIAIDGGQSAHGGAKRAFRMPSCERRPPKPERSNPDANG